MLSWKSWKERCCRWAALWTRTKDSRPKKVPSFSFDWGCGVHRSPYFLIERCIEASVCAQPHHSVPSACVAVAGVVVVAVVSCVVFGL